MKNVCLFQKAIIAAMIAALLLGGVTATVQADLTVIQPVGTTLTPNNDSYLQYDPRWIDGSGLMDASIVQTGDVVPAVWPEHISGYNNTRTERIRNADEFETLTFDLGGAFELSGMVLWNSTESGQTDRGFEHTALFYSTDGGATFIPGETLTWTERSAEATGNQGDEPVDPATFAPEVRMLTTSLSGVTHVRMVVDNFSAAGANGIIMASEIRFIAGTDKPVAHSPNPSAAETLIPIDPVLSWSAPSHPDVVQTTGYDVYLSTSQADVVNRTVSARVSANQPGVSFTPAADLDYQTTYYWCVDAINEMSGGGSLTEPGTVWQFFTVPEPITTFRPLIWAKASERDAINQKIKNYPWASDVYIAMKSRVAGEVAAHQANRDAYLRQLPINWSLSDPVFYQYGQSGYDRNEIRKFLMVGIDCAIIHFLSGDDKYGQCASDVMHNIIEGYTGLPLLDDTVYGGWLLDDVLYEARLMGAQIPIIYDFIYPHLQVDPQVYDVKTGQEATFSYTDAQFVIRTYFERVRDKGGRGSNHPVLESVCLVQNALGLDDPAERDAAVQVYLTDGTYRQQDLEWIDSQYGQIGDIWPEPLQYSGGCNNWTTLMMTLIDRYDPSLNLLQAYPKIVNSMARFSYLRNPNGESIRYGDMGRYSDPPYFFYEAAYRHAADRGLSDYQQLYGSLIQGGIVIGEYDRSNPQGWDYGVSPYFSPLQLLLNASVVAEAPELVDYPRTDVLPFAGIALQRNESTQDNRLYGLMCQVGGAAYVHSHAAGMNMELHGLGQVLGADAGSDVYGTAIHENYYRVFAAHNTVIVNGASRGEGGWGNIGINSVQVEAMEPVAFEPAIAPDFSFTCTSFEDNKGTLAEATQQRTMAIVRTSPTSGYYVDVFRSDSSLASEHHDYLYHNIGDSLSIETAGGSALTLTNEPSRFQNDIGDEYQQPGWRYFEDVYNGASTESIRARFNLNSLPDGAGHMDAHIPGNTGREYCKVTAPKTKDAPGNYKNNRTPTLVVRQNGPAWDRPFVVVYEPSLAGSETVQSVTSLADNGRVVGVKVESLVDGKSITDWIIAQDAITETYTNAQDNIYFEGRFGIIRRETQDGHSLVSLYIGDGYELSFEGFTLQGNAKNQGYFQENENVHYTLDGDVLDSSGNGYDGTLVGGSFAPSLVEHDRGVLFDGVDDYIEIPNHKGVTGQDSRTCSAWIKTTQPSGEMMAWGTSDSGAKWIVRVNETGSLRAEVQGGYIFGTTPINDGLWHHVAVVLDSDGTPDISEVRLYVDGQPDAIAGVLAYPIFTAAGQDVSIGVYSTLGVRYFQGMIDDVRVYSSALTESEIANLAFITPPSPDIVADYIIDLTDLSALAVYWLDDDCFSTSLCDGRDLNADQSVNQDDFLVLAQLWLDPITESTAKVGMDFGSATTMVSTEEAGAPDFAQAHWNSQAGNNSSLNSLLDGEGNPTSISMSWTAHSAYSNPAIADNPGNNRMMKGYLDTSNDSTTKVTITGIPYAGYSLVIYTDGYNVWPTNPATDNQRNGVFTVVDPSSSSVIAGPYVAQDAPGVQFNGTFIETTPLVATDDATTPAGNYMIIKGLTSPTIRLEATGGYNTDSTSHPRAAINAIQIVEQAGF